jgi:hypothetical protein
MRLELPILRLAPRDNARSPRTPPIPDVFAATLPVCTLVELAGRFHIDDPGMEQNAESDLVPFIVDQH